MNAIEKAAIAKSISDYIIDHLLYEPISAAELHSLVRDIGDDKVSIHDESIIALAIKYFSEDPRIVSGNSMYSLKSV